MLQIYKGHQIGGGGVTILPMTQAEYLANKSVLDASDFLIDITDDTDQLGYADEVGYSNSDIDLTTHMDFIGDIATRAIGKIEYTDTAKYAHAVGEYFINKDGDYCRCTSAIAVNGALTKNTNYVVTDIASEMSIVEDVSNLVTFSGTNLTVGSKKCYKIGKIVNFVFSNISVSATISNWTKLGEFDVKIRPQGACFATISGSTSGMWVRYDDIRAYGNIPTLSNAVASGMFICR